ARLAPVEVRDDAIVQATRPPASPPPLAPPVAVVRPARPLAAGRRPANRRHRAGNRAAIPPPRPSRPVPPRGTSATPGTGDPVREQRGRLARPRCYNRPTPVSEAKPRHVPPGVPASSGGGNHS